MCQNDPHMTIRVEIESGTTRWAIMVTDFFLEKCYVKNKIYVECTKNSWERIIIELKHYFANMENLLPIFHL